MVAICYASILSVMGKVHERTYTELSAALNETCGQGIHSHKRELDLVRHKRNITLSLSSTMVICYPEMY
jgi:hypothetical protein